MDRQKRKQWKQEEEEAWGTEEDKETWGSEEEEETWDSEEEEETWGSEEEQEAWETEGEEEPLDPEVQTRDPGEAGGDDEWTYEDDPTEEEKVRIIFIYL